MACQLFRTDGKVEKVLAPNEKPSLLYSEILTVVKKEGSKKFIDSIPYLRDRLEDGTLLNESSEEIAVGIWSIAYSPEYQAFFNNLNKKLNVFLIVSFLGTVSNTPFGDEVHTLMSLLAIVGNETAPKFINAVFEPVPPMVSNNVV